MAIEEADLVWLETVELPPLSRADARRFQADIWATASSIDLAAVHAFCLRYDQLDRLDVACGDTTLPLAQRERIARAFFRVAGWESVARNELNEGQKAWALTMLKKKSQEPERILAIWAASADPHAALVGALRAALPDAKAVEIGGIVERICGGWIFGMPEANKSELRTALRRFAELVATRGVVEAVLHWLPAIPDLERRVLHACAVLATDGSERSATALRRVLAELDDRSWAEQILARLAPKGSPVAALFGTGTPIKKRRG